MAVDPKAQAKRAQEAAAEAKAAAKAAAVASAKAEAKSEAQAPPSVVQTAVAASTTESLDVFTASNATPAAQRADAGQRELSSDQERMVEASGAGRSSALNPGKPGQVADPDLARMGRPGGQKSPGGPSTGANPFGDRAEALRDTPAAAENPLDSFGKIDNAGDRLREATGRGGGLEGAADRLSPFADNPATPANPGVGGKGAISDTADGVLVAGVAAIASAVVGGAAVVAGAPVVAAAAATAGVAAVATGVGGLVGDAAVNAVVWVNERNSPEEQMANAAFENAKLAHAERAAAAAAAAPHPEPKMPLTPIVGGQVGGGKTGVKDPEPEGEDTPLPPGMIDGDLLLPPSLRTGATVGGATGNDGVDWAHSRRAATNPSREDSGGVGGKETYTQKAGKNSLISQPERDDGAGGGGMNGISGSGTPQNSGGATRPEDGSAWTGPTRTEDPGPINMNSSEGIMAGVFNSGDDDDDTGSRD